MPIGTHALDFGAYVMPGIFGAQARYTGRLSEHWSAYTRAYAGRGIGGMTYGAEGGLGVRW